MSDSFLSEQDALKVLRSGDLQTWTRMRLVQIAGGTSASAAVRAIEMLMSVGGEVADDDFDGIPLEELSRAKAAVNARLRELEQEYLETMRINENGDSNPVRH